jgi:asparaginyl-tRNA synthetase
MKLPLAVHADRMVPPRSWRNEPGAFLAALRSPWYATVADLQDVVLRATVDFAHGRGLRAIQVPLTTRTVTCANGHGSDAQPVPVTVNGVRTFLSDSIQFALEYGCRVSPGGCYGILPSFRGEEPDETHLNQYAHSEAEIVGGLDDVIEYVEEYLRHVARAILQDHGRDLAALIHDVTHLERLAGSTGSCPRLTFDDAARLLADHPDSIRGENGCRTLTRRGERRLMEVVGDFLWVTHFDHLAVPFYQAFADDGRRTAACADMFFGMGEVVGAGERHQGAAELRRALDLHAVSEKDYSWYVRMKDELSMRTSGFGMGVERFLMWVLQHDDIRDIPLISRVDEEPAWPAVVERP